MIIVAVKQQPNAVRIEPNHSIGVVKLQSTVEKYSSKLSRAERSIHSFAGKRSSQTDVSISTISIALWEVQQPNQREWSAVHILCGKTQKSNDAESQSGARYSHLCRKRNG